MKEVSVANDIIPIGEFKAQASRLLKRLGDGSGPLIVTQNGRPAGVIRSPADYDRLRYSARFLESVAAGITDADAGRAVDTDGLRERLISHRDKRTKT